MSTESGRQAPSIFISYRIADTLPIADRLAAELQRIFGTNSVYFDHRAVEPGDAWEGDMEAAVQGAAVVLVLIGKKWLTEQDAYGSRRLDKSGDWVRREVETALISAESVIPVLVDGASLPPKEAFESVPSIAALPGRQCAELRTRDWDTDFGALVDLLAKKTGLDILDQPTKLDEDNRKSPEQFPPDYLQCLKESVSRIELLGLNLKENIPDGLPKIYVPALTHRDVDLTRAEDDREERHQLLLERLGVQSLYVPGAPGSGKSTFCQWLAYIVADGEVPEHEVRAPGDYQEALPGSLRGKLPVLIRLRDIIDIWSLGTPASGDWNRNDLERSLGGWLDNKKPLGLTGSPFLHSLREGELLLMFDGIDELPEEHIHGGSSRYPRHDLLSGLSGALPEWEKAGNRILITSRPYGLTSSQRAKLPLGEASLLPLSTELQQLFVQRWFAAADHAQWQLLSDGFEEEVSGKEEIGRLLDNPLLLTALCVKYKEGKRLPHDVYQLYNSVVEQVLFNRFRKAQGERERVRWRLEAVALGMHYDDEQDPVPSPRASISVGELDQILARYAKQNRHTEGDLEGVQVRREELLEKTGLLRLKGEEAVEFFHQDFRDFLAAEGWSRSPLGLRDALEKFGGDRDWRRMLGFLFAREIEVQGGIDRPLQSLEELKRESPETSAGGLVLGDCLEIAAGKASQWGLGEEWQRYFSERCRRGIDTIASAADRNELLLSLGRLGWDTRPGVALDEQGMPDIEWLPVPSDGRPEFYIAKYPVTNAQFQAFVDDEGGYRKESWWTGLDRLSNEPDQPRWKEPNAPRIDVNWFEAMAFCRWLSAAGIPAVAGWKVDLPQEEEWVGAYVGQKERDYPWQGEPDGQRHANFRESQLGRTSAVGLFPAGEASSGALDMAGNVFEWCFNTYGDKPEGGVLRGGSWGDLPGYLRSSFRSGDNPGYRFGSVGFRLVCRPHSF